MRRTPLTLAGSLVLLLGVAIACNSKADSPGQDPEGAAAPPEDATFSITVEASPLKVGARSTAKLIFKPAAGYKWNKEYPAKVIFEKPGKLAVLAKTTFKQSAGDFQSVDKQASVPIPLRGASAGHEELIAEARFSVCDAKVCLIKKEKVVLAVDVTP